MAQCGTGARSVRWRRYGKDRLYVRSPDEVTIGWWDLTTDEAHSETPRDLVTLTAAVEAWRSAQSVGPTAESPGEAADSVPQVGPAMVEEPAALDMAEVPTGAAETVLAVDRPWLDLATNEPGAAAREQAVAAKDAAPVRALLARVLSVHADERASQQAPRSRPGR